MTTMTAAPGWRSSLVAFVIVIQASLLILTNIPLPIEGDCTHSPSSSQRTIPSPHGTNAAVDASHIQTPISKFLPKRLLNVFGLESSGTTFVTSLLETSIGVEQRIITKGRMDKASKLPHREYELQHLSLPSGIWCETSIESEEVVPVMYPSLCIRMHPGSAVRTKEIDSIYRKTLPTECSETMMGDFPADGRDYVYPKRYFVNITSHVQWYRDRGVEASAVLVVRDKSIGSIARSFVHCKLPKLREAEEQLGIQIMREAIENFENEAGTAYATPPLVVLSYETLVAVGLPYLNHVLDQLRLPRLDIQHLPGVKDGNARYIQSGEEIAKLEKQRDRKKPKVSAGRTKQQGSSSTRRGKPHYEIEEDVESSDEKE